MKNIIKNTNKKGFTIVELVIVIAVIAILAGVLIPTFSSIITKAHESAALQEAQAVYKEVYAVDLSDGTLDGNNGKDAEGNYISAESKVTCKGTIEEYDPDAKATGSEQVVKFEYKASNKKTVTLKVDSEGAETWTVSDTPASTPTV